MSQKLRVANNKQIVELDSSSVTRDIRFFYPFEIQIVDEDNHKGNSEGEASHLEYKKSQLKSAISRLFRPLIEYKGLSF